MAFQMIHMEIAYRLLKQLQIKNVAEFILGSVAPDAVHMNPDYKVSMKVKTHMFEGCGTWSDTQDYKQWKKNITDYLQQFVDESMSEDKRAFLLGLCVHCLTDYWNDLKIWRKLQKEHIPPFELNSFREAYYPEAKGIDVWLYQNSPNTEKIREMLFVAKAFDVKGLVNVEDLERQRKHLLYVQYCADKVELSEYQFLSAEFIEAFVEFVVEDIAETINTMIEKMDVVS